jgi:hypothetical protein
MAGWAKSRPVIRIKSLPAHHLNVLVPWSPSDAVTAVTGHLGM